MYQKHISSRFYGKSKCRWVMKTYSLQLRHNEPNNVKRTSEKSWHEELFTVLHFVGLNMRSVKSYCVTSHAFSVMYKLLISSIFIISLLRNTFYYYQFDNFLHLCSSKNMFFSKLILKIFHFRKAYTFLYINCLNLNLLRWTRKVFLLQLLNGLQIPLEYYWIHTYGFSEEGLCQNVTPDCRRANKYEIKWAFSCEYLKIFFYFKLVYIFHFHNVTQELMIV